MAVSDIYFTRLSFPFKNVQTVMKFVSIIENNGELATKDSTFNTAAYCKENQLIYLFQNEAPEAGSFYDMVAVVNDGGYWVAYKAQADARYVAVVEDAASLTTVTADMATAVYVHADGAIYQHEAVEPDGTRPFSNYVAVADGGGYWVAFYEDRYLPKMLPVPALRICLSDGAGGFMAFANGVYENTGAWSFGGLTSSLRKFDPLNPGTLLPIGQNSFVAGMNNAASGRQSTAIGENNNVQSPAGFAGGFNNTVTGNNGVAIGNTCSAGFNGVALGHTNTSSGNGGFAAGAFMYSRGFGEVAVGIYGEDYTATNTIADRLFYVGNGTGTTDRKTALCIRRNGNMSIGHSSPTSKVDIESAQGFNQLRLRTSYTPTSSSDANGAVGDVSWDENFFYVKTAAGWKRTALATF